VADTHHLAYSALNQTGVKVTARKPNYDFERREREKNKAAEAAKKAQAKADKKAAAQGEPDAES
jgi:hypothetical protein